MQRELDPAQLADFRVLGETLDKFMIGGDAAPPPETLAAYVAELKERAKLYYSPRVHPFIVEAMAHNVAHLVDKLRTSEMATEDVEDLLDAYVAPALRGVTAWLAVSAQQNGSVAMDIDKAFAGIVAVVRDMATRE